MTAPAATRIAVTGVGAVTPAGIGTQALWTTVLSGQSQVRRIDRPVIIEPTLGQSPLLAAAPVVAGDRLVGLAAIQLPPFGALATIAFDQAGHAFPRHPIAGG